MYDHTFYKQEQIRHQATHKAGCQTGDFAYGHFNLPPGFVWVYGLTLKVLVTTIDAEWEGMADVGSARYELALLPPCPTIRVLSYSN